MSNIIYQPAGKAQEYARWAINHYDGCQHGCVYCYAAGLAVRFKRCENRETFHKKAVVKKTFSLEALEKEAKNKAKIIGNDRVLLSFTTDPMQGEVENKTRLTRKIIEILHQYGIGVHILTKNPMMAWFYRDVLDREKDAIAATLTFSKREVERSQRWEPNADLPTVRMCALEMLHEAGFFTWASLEPVIDPASTLRIIEETHTYIDHYKVGKLNYVDQLPPAFRDEVLEMRIDWVSFVKNVKALLNMRGFTEVSAHHEAKKTYQVKDSLKKF